MVKASPANPPINVLLTPVVMFLPASSPTAVLYIAWLAVLPSPIRFSKAALPIATFLSALMLTLKAFCPIAIFLLPTVAEPRDATPKVAL